MSETQPEESSNPIIDTAEELKIIHQTIDELGIILNQSASDIHYATGELLLKRMPGLSCEENGIVKSLDPGETRQDLFGKFLVEIASRSKEETWLPKKTYLYNSINLVLDKKLIGDSETYNALSISHKIALLQVKDLKEKEKLIEEIVSMPVREARLLIEGSKPARKKGAPALISFIRKPDTISDVKNLDLVLSKTVREKMIDKASSKIDELKNQSETIARNLSNLESLLEKIKNAQEPKKGRKPTVSKDAVH